MVAERLREGPDVAGGVTQADERAEHVPIAIYFSIWGVVQLLKTSSTRTRVEGSLHGPHGRTQHSAFSIQYSALTVKKKVRLVMTRLRNSCSREACQPCNVAAKCTTAIQEPPAFDTIRYDTIRYDTIRYSYLMNDAASKTSPVRSSISARS